MSNQGLELDVFGDLLREATIIGQLASDEKAFTEAYKAFRSGDARAYQRAAAGG